MALRTVTTPFTPPFIEQGDGIAPALGDDVRVCPFLPRLRRCGDAMGAYKDADSWIVIEAGEPIAVYTDAAGKKWLVPSATTAYTLTYGADDVGTVESIDSAGTYVAATGASSASIPALLPIGLAHQPIRQNPALSTTGALHYDNFDSTLKEVVIRRRHFTIPYRRRGVNAIPKVVEGDLIAVGTVNGNTLSVANRPKLVPARMSMSVDNPVEATRGSILITPTDAAHASVGNGDYVEITVEGLKVRFTIAAAADATNWQDIKIVKGADTQALVEGLTAAILASALAPRLASVTEDNAAVTVTALNYGAATALVCTINDIGNDGWDAPAVNQGVSGTGRLHADGVYDALHLGAIVGRAIRVWDALPGTFDMTKVITPRNSGLSGSGTNGVPQEYYFSGNTYEGAQLPSAYTNAGALLLTYEL